MNTDRLKIYIYTILLIISSDSFAQKWPATSVLSTGKWIEITTEGEGVRKITYDTLREMGFDDPVRVRVFGRSGEQLPVAMYDSEGLFRQPTDIEPIGTAHIGDAMYFYVTGTDIYEFVPDAAIASGGMYRRLGKNIYAGRQTFILTDSAEGLVMEYKMSEIDDSIDKESLAIGLIFHEKDLALNDSNNGQLFWGEEFPADGSRLGWDFSLPGASGMPAVMQYSLHIESEQISGPQGEYTFGISYPDGSESSRSQAPVRNKTSYHAPQKTEPYEFTMESDTGKIFTSYDRGGSDCNVANLDWWSVTVGFDIANRLKSNEDNFTFTLLSNGRQRVSVPIAEGMAAMDVTDPAEPKLLRTEGPDGEIAIDFQGDECRKLTFFRTDGSLKGAASWKAVGNQNLHSLSQEGVDFAIICLPWLADKALEIASLHESEMGQKCAVATTEEIYREFSGATPDPMAYRNFVKMLYDAPRKIKNLLLFGSIAADARGVRADESRGERIISYQKALSSKHDGAMSDVDIYGIMDRRISATSSLESMEVAVGIGILPISSVSEADLYITKLKRYLDGDGMENVIADHLLIGCDGDNHQHEIQSESIRNQLSEYCDGYRHVPVYNELTGAPAAKEKMIESINSGIGLATYLGHGGCFYLTKEDGHFKYSDLRYLRNPNTPFMFFAACNITNGDMGQRGMSEQMVVGDRFGLIGAVTSNRTAMSTSNYDLTRVFYSELHPQTNSNGEIALTTVGEAYARTKSTIKSTNELAFQLMCDPAIVIPMPSYSMTDPAIEIRLGDMNVLTGHIVSADGKSIENFNGKASAKLLVAGGESEIAGVVPVKEEDITVAIGSGTVKDGRYEIKIAPGSQCIGSKTNLKIMITAYDPATRIGAASIHACKLSTDQTSSLIGQTDIMAPTVESVEYDDSMCAVVITSSDDTALDLSATEMRPGFTVSVDGKLIQTHLLRNVEFLPDASRCRHTLYLSNPEAGVHTVGINLRDVAGNASIYERIFTVGNRENALSMRAECRHTDGEIDFMIERGECTGIVTIFLTDQAGKRIMAVNADGNRTTVSTRTIPAGVARAFCEDSASGQRSNTIVIPIIKPESYR